ncbi:MAG TPA: UPF0182 family protein [Terracidiphilus sp.]|nr:UPF0182 family protein [Terracidiphilus sp.]
MPESFEWPSRVSGRQQRRGRKLLILVAAVVAIILFSARTAVAYWVNLLWFRSLGFEAVFWKTQAMQWSVFAAFAVLTFLILYGAFRALRSSHSADLPDTHTVFIAGRPLSFPVDRFLRYAAALIAIVIALATGAAMAGQWSTLALYWYAPRGIGGRPDPILSKPLGFYLFTLPAWHLVLGWLLTLAVLICVAAVLFVLASGGMRALDTHFGGGIVVPWRGLSIAGGCLLAVLAVNEYISRYDLLFDHHTIFDGVNYTQAYVTLLGMWFIAAALLIGAIVAIAGGIVKPRGRWLVAAVLPAVGCYILFGIAGWYTSNFVVNPNQLDKERPYIEHNIAMTRQAYGLDRFSRHEFPAETSVDALDAAHNQQTLDNVRLWDWRALQSTLRQIQEIRTYYDFPDIDIDRYQINGALHEVMLATRELNQDKLPSSSRNWINDKLIYTHGYGVTMNSVNGFTPEGLPTLYLSNMPVDSTVPSLKVTRPEVYFGEMTYTDVYVKTHQQEFNYPQGQANNLSTYEGTGGIEMGGFLRRSLIAFDRGDLTKVPFSDDITGQSRLLMRRNVAARVSALAPFLTFDQDPYIVVGDDGRLYWIMDAFTSSDTYPYSTHYTLAGQQEVNYIRNSVKAVVDAYNGTVTFYVFDREDPILAAWRGIFPGLFKDASEMPGLLQKHVRYPELLLALQAQVYGLYHMTNPEVFYNREDLWTVATETVLGEDGQQSVQAMAPNFVLMTLPGETNPEFVEILPFTPVNRNNMIGWIAGRSDGANYGNTVVYDFPKTRLVDGPQQVEARIDQNAQLSGQLTLWNQQGSHVRRGTLLVIPCGKGLLYAEPIYLQASNSPMPELRLVVLAVQDRLAYGPTFSSALAALFGTVPSSLSETAELVPPPQPNATASNAPAGAQAAPNQQQLIRQANQDFTDYQRLTSQGKLTEAGQKLDDLKRVLSRLNAQSK